MSIQKDRGLSPPWRILILPCKCSICSPSHPFPSPSLSLSFPPNSSDIARRTKTRFPQSLVQVHLGSQAEGASLFQHNRIYR